MYATRLPFLLSQTLAAAVALGLALACAGPAVSPLLLASMGGSTVFLFGLTAAPAAQPRAVIGGHLGGALIGITCYQLLGGSDFTAVLATVLTMAFMLSTRTVHPPAGANPLIMVYCHASWPALMRPVALGITVLLVTVMIWSRLDRRAPHYPLQWAQASPPS